MLKSIVTLTAVVGLAAAASAQTGSGPTTPFRTGGLAGLLGGDNTGVKAIGGLPDLAGIGAGNAAGLLGYCIQNNLLGGLTGQAGSGATRAADGGASSILQRLTGRQGVTTSPGYQAGQSGQVVAPSGQALSLDGLRGQVKNRVCGLVLKRARSFL